MERIKISNFRKIKDSWDLDLSPITFFTGKNNSGKSSVLKSLMVLSDYGKSNNHLEINFKGKLNHKHKIQDYSNAVNWHNDHRDNIKLEFQRSGYNIKLVFSPKEDDNNKDDKFQKGKLETLEIIRIFDDVFFRIDYSAGAYIVDLEYPILNSETEKKLASHQENLMEALRVTEIEIEKEEKAIIKNSLLKGTANLIPSLGVLGLLKYLIKKESKTKQLQLLSLKNKIERLEANKKQLEKKIKNETDNKERDNLLINTVFYSEDFKGQESTLNFIINKIVADEIRNESKKYGLLDMDNEIKRLFEFSRAVSNLFQFDIFHLSTQRSNQNKLLSHNNTDFDINKITRDFVNDKLDSNIDVIIFMQYWMSKDCFDLGEDFQIITYENSISKIEIKENGIWVNLADKGFGAGQIFTILLSIAFLIPKPNELNMFLEKDLSIILIEEPEANLHPKLQSLLAELFFDANYKYGIRFILETHSEYMIRKSQYLSIENNNYFKLFYFDGESPYQINYKKDGSLDRNFGEGFLDVSDDIALDIFMKTNKDL